jgi:hypothetical protein
MSALVADQRLEALRFRALPLVERSDGFAAWCRAGEAKYGEPFWAAEFEKMELRRRWRRPTNGAVWGEHAEYMARASAFWAEYQAINDRWIPADPVYSGVRQGITPGAAVNILYVLSAAASGNTRILESFFAGEAGASGVQRNALNRPSGAGTGSATNQTPEKFSTRSPAAAGTFTTAYATTNPTASTNDLITQTFNAFGGSDRWVPQPGEELYVVNGEQIYACNRSGVNVESLHCIFEEL